MAKYTVVAIVDFKVAAPDFNSAEKLVIERIDDKMGENTGLISRIVTSIHLHYPEAEG